jgi:hypothetical protein
MTLFNNNPKPPIFSNQIKKLSDPVYLKNHRKNKIRLNQKVRRIYKNLF